MQIAVFAWVFALIANIVGLVDISWWIMLSPALFFILRLVYQPFKVIFANNIKKKK